MNLKNKTILITGADGFIGSHLTEMLVKKGAKVRVLSLYNAFNFWGWLEDTDCLNEIGEIFGISYSGISHTVRRLKERLEKDKMLREKLNPINFVKNQELTPELRHLNYSFGKVILGISQLIKYIKQI